MFLQQPLDRDRELSQKALDDWPTLGKLIFYLNLQNISGKRYKAEALETQKRCLSMGRPVNSVDTSVSGNCSVVDASV